MFDKIFQNTDVINSQKVLSEKLAMIIQAKYKAVYVKSDWSKVEYDDFLESWACTNSQKVWYIKPQEIVLIQ